MDPFKWKLAVNVIRREIRGIAKDGQVEARQPKLEPQQQEERRRMSLNCSSHTGTTYTVRDPKANLLLTSVPGCSHGNCSCSYCCEYCFGLVRNPLKPGSGYFFRSGRERNEEGAPCKAFYGESPAWRRQGLYWPRLLFMVSTIYLRSYHYPRRHINT